MPIPLSRISLVEAQNAVAAAVAQAQERGVAAAVVVVDDAARVVASARMDGAVLMAMDTAAGKAYTAAGQQQDTSLWDEYVASAPGFGGAITSIPGFTPFGGGLCLRAGEVLIGAIGVSGGAIEDDIAIAEAGRTAVSSDT